MDWITSVCDSQFRIIVINIGSCSNKALIYRAESYKIISSLFDENLKLSIRQIMEFKLDIGN
jgi:acetate kinase